MKKLNDPNHDWSKETRLSRLKDQQFELVKCKSNEDRKKVKHLIINRIRILQHLKRKKASVDQNSKLLKFTYCRYAGDWIILTNGTILQAKKKKNDIKEWLLSNLDATLAEDKTLITNISEKPARFLGFEIKASKNRKLLRVLKGFKVKKITLSKVAGTEIITNPAASSPAFLFCNEITLFEGYLIARKEK